MTVDAGTVAFLAGVMIGVALVVYGLRKAAPDAVKKLGGFQWLVPVVSGATATFGAALAAGATTEEAALAAVGGALAGFGAAGGHHAARDVPFLPYGNSKPDEPPL
jgi:hypothetical protein